MDRQRPAEEGAYPQWLCQHPPRRTSPLGLPGWPEPNGPPDPVELHIEKTSVTIQPAPPTGRILNPERIHDPVY